MLGILNDAIDLSTDFLIQDPDFFYQIPRAGVVDQEFGLLAFLDQRITKICFIDRLPVYGWSGGSDQPK